MLKDIFRSKIVKAKFPAIYRLETAQYFNDCENHYQKMVEYHGFLPAQEDQVVNLFDYKGRFYFENQIFTERFFKNLFSKPVEVVFRNCTFVGCDFVTDDQLKFVFHSCRFEIIKNEAYGSIHNRFNGNLGAFVFRNVDHAIIICNRPGKGDTSFDLLIENCNDISIYIVGYTKIHLNAKFSKIKRICLKDSNFVISHVQSQLNSFILLPPLGRDNLHKCSDLYQTTNSVMSEDLLQKSNRDYYPINLLRQLSKKYKFREELYEYQVQLAAQVPLEVLYKPKRDLSIYVMQTFDFFSYPLSLSIRSLFFIFIYAGIYMFTGLSVMGSREILILDLTQYTAMHWHHWTSLFSKTLYFSIASFTTAGYGDYVMPPGFELLAASEALMGVILSGALITSIFNRFHN